MTTNKLTDKKIYTAIVEGTFDDLDVDAIVAWAGKKLAQIAHKAEKAKETAAKKRAEGDALTDAVYAVLTDEFQTIADIAAQVEGDDITASKVSYRLNVLSKAENPTVEKGEVTLEGDKGKRTVVGYRKIG